MHDLPGSSDAVETQTGLCCRDFKVPSLVLEISSSGSKVPGTFGETGLNNVLLKSMIQVDEACVSKQNEFCAHTRFSTCKA